LKRSRKRKKTSSPVDEIALEKKQEEEEDPLSGRRDST